MSQAGPPPVDGAVRVDAAATAIARAPAPTLVVSVTPVLSYALAYNQIAVVHRVDVTNPGPGIKAATLRIGVETATGPLGPPADFLVDLAPGGTTTVAEPGVWLDPAAMAGVEQQQPGGIRVSLVVDQQVIAERVEPVRILAANQWQAAPELLGLEMLAAFVLPHDPVIGGLLAEAGQILLERTGNPVLNGYQDGADRVDEVARALFEVIQAKQIRFVTAPESWTDTGHLVRTPGEVLGGRVGTALDTAVLLGAALEQAGLRPLIFVAQGHAFLGYWRDERALAGPAQTEIADVVNLIDLDLIRLIETTTVTVTDPPWTFEASHRPPYAAFLTGDLTAVHGVVDIQQSRVDRIVPLPVHLRAPDGTMQNIVYSRTDRTAAPGPAVTGAPAAPVGSPNDIPPRIEQWKNALLDLSLRNKLINFHRRGGISLTVPDGLLGAVEDRVHEPPGLLLLGSDQVSTVAAERGIGLGRDLPADQLGELFRSRGALFTDVPAASYDGRLRALAYKAKTVIEETGANNLYLALGSLLWQLDDRELRSPLVLVPVRLTTRARQQSYRVSIDEAGTSTPNYCLLEKLRLVHGLHVPGLAQPGEDALGIDLDGALQAMREALAEAGLPFRVEASAELAVLQFAKYRLWKDLADHWPSLIANPLVNHLVRSPYDPFIDPVDSDPRQADLDELAAGCPVPADASQAAAVGDAAAGRTFVLEGPPGTGKSQTITNLLARAVADGRRVLFVAEKRAALDVVTRRLDAIGLGPFCLDLHDKSSKPTVVRAQIRAALEHQVAVDDQGLAATAEDLRASRGQLARYAARLHEQNGAGLSFYSARTALLTIGEETAALPIPVALLEVSRADELAALRRSLTTLGDVAEPAGPRPDHPWGFVDAGPDDDWNPGSVDIPAVGSAAIEFDAAVASLPGAGAIGEVLRSVCSSADLGCLLGLIDRPDIALPVLDETRSARWQQATVVLSQQIGAFAAATHPGLDVATPAAMDLPLAELHQQALAAAGSSWFGRKGRLIAVREQLTPALRPGSEVEPKEVPGLAAALLQIQGIVRGFAAQAAVLPGVIVPAGWNPLTEQGREQLTRQIEWLRWAGSTLDPATGNPFTQALRRWVSSGHLASVPERQSLLRVSQALAALLASCSTTGDAVATEATNDAVSTGETVSAWAGDLGLFERWRSTAPARAIAEPGLATLRRWLAFLVRLEPLRRARATQARALLLSGGVGADDAVRAFDAGVALASSVERRDSTGLGTFDTVAHGRQISRFTTSAGGIRSLLTTAIPRQVLHRRSFDAASGLGQVGELQRELAKQRRGLPVRGLLERYGELITAIMPCMLVSPDSLARFFPPRPGLFDLVVFDEASQIRVADAVGAMGRGRSVVVVGDSKQMPPTSFAELNLSGAGDDSTDSRGEGSWVEEAIAEAVPAEDEESILTECVQARVPQRWLSWHYRSQDESLIAFSNRQYYAGGLSSFPAPGSGVPHPGIAGHGISLIRVDGVFHRSGAGKALRTNPIEAQAVVDEIKRRFAADPARTPSIGVVTFNVQQRTLIESMLRDSGDERLVAALDGVALDGAEVDGSVNGADAATVHDGLFVKNLENVQGDERDVILFSTAFSVNSRGSLPLNFGPLNRAGGERRLNVAITRARRQVLVFSSFDPAQLRAEETSSVGIKHLRAYLDLAQQGPRALGPLPAGRQLRLTDRHREEIANALRQQGFHVQSEVGLSDFTIDLVVAPAEQPDEPVLAVLLDGPGWAGRRTVGDRDGLPVEVLSKLMHWPAVERVWMPEWLSARDPVLTRLAGAVQEAVAQQEKSAELAARSGDADLTDDGGVAEDLANPAFLPEMAAVDADLARPGGGAAGPENSGELVDALAGDDAGRPLPVSQFEHQAADALVAVDGFDHAGPDNAGPDHAGPVMAPVDRSVQRASPPATARVGLPGETPFIPWVPPLLGDRGVLDALPTAGAVQLVYQAMIAGIEAEGPIHRDRLIRGVAASFGLHRVVAARHAAIQTQLPPSLLGDAEDPHLVWPPSLDPLSWQGFRRTPDGVERPLEQISVREIGNAMVALCGAAAGMSQDQLWAGTLEIFGFTRRSAAHAGRLETALRLLLDSSRVIKRGDGVLVV